MRQAPVFRRCGKCGARWAPNARRCECGHGTASWAFQVDIAPPGMKRKQVRKGGFATRQEAVDALASLQRESHEGRYVDPDKVIVETYFNDWIARLRLTGEVRANTADEWAGHVRSHIVPRLGQVRLQQLTTAMLMAFYGELHATGHQRTGGPLAPKSVWNVHRAVYRALSDAVKLRLIAGNPATGAMKRPEQVHEVQYWTSEQLASFIAWVDVNRDQQDQAFYRLATATGMRRGELLGLRWRDLDLEGASLTVVQQMARHRQATAPKTRAGRRSITLGPDVIAALRAWQDAQAFQRRAWADAYEDEGLVFTRENGTSHDPRVVSHRFTKLVADAGVKRIRFHDLRHTSAVIGLRELGEWPDEVSKRLGHTSVAFTLDTYGHLMPARGRTVAEAFDKLIRERLAKQAERAERGSKG